MSKEMVFRYMWLFDQFCRRREYNFGYYMDHLTHGDYCSLLQSTHYFYNKYRIGK